ncbi:MAG: 23S rRNA (pseudouridine(1915)-N(3))-methyltransferase RlmH [Gemmatimonadota bacterium]|nr:23S rRNA (pseudouridine(1915)-N(3))-methyltransferase RlmH [Gemmatimonadota bacterium]MDE3174337.1 23S rRNA (pseudouridine(1915)-N(3))-methyltransferase RlmH [Gemmatimonadota bacterium]MDE3217656.1 23S rRNA (pseudouridine(1915)-N(3))-methyltransferase RlmH [Gemmatimonadota bacterium]
MRFILAAVGKPRDAALAAAIASYELRASRYWPLEVHEVKEEPARSLAPDQVRAREGARLAGVAGAAELVVCDERGASLTSDAFARFLQEARERARDVAFVIGGAYGLDPALAARAKRRLALAPWTLPHEMARLVLAEQFYRAGTIIRGEPYHK